MARFARHSQDNQEPHRFEVYELTATEDPLVAELAADVRALYLDHDFDAVIEQAARDLDAVSDSQAMAELLQSAAQSTIPEPAQRTTQPWLDTARNELAEIICYAALEELFGATVPAKRVRHKEIPHQMSRGMDALALAADPGEAHGLRVYLSETKASSSADTPPDVVDRTEDSLHKQLRAAIATRTRVASELARALSTRRVRSAIAWRARWCSGAPRS